MQTDAITDFPELQQTRERRIATRNSTRLSAYFLLGADSYPVSIQDYSADGLFLAFEMDAPSIERSTQWIGLAGAVEVARSALADLLGEIESADDIAAIEARVVRVEAHGVGVHVSRLPSAWSALLEHAAKRPVADVRTSNREYEQLIARCISVYGTFSRKLAAEVLARTADRLGALEGSDPFAAARFDYEGARAAIATRSPQIIERFVSEGVKRVTFGPEADDVLNRPMPFGELRLMQADELEDYLAVSAVIKHVDIKVAQALDQFEMRYIRLVGSSIAPKKSPFGPEKTLRAFREALSGVSLSPQSARVMCESLEAVALIRIPELLADLNHMLLAVTPAMRAARQVSSRAHTGYADSLSVLPDVAVPDGPTQQLLSALRQKHGTGQPRIPRRVLGVIDSMAAAARKEAQAKVKIEPSLLPLEGEQTEGPEASLVELLAAIDRLPMSSGGAFEQASAREVMALMQTISADGTAAQRRLTESHQAVIDTSARLFKRASRDFVAESDVEALIKRLERTLLKLALRDGEFPSSPGHPARKVVNLIDQYNFAADDAGRLSDQKLRKNLDSLVTRICEQADTDSGVFGVVQHSLEQDVESVRRERRIRVDRIVEALEGRDRVRVARDQVEAAFTGRLSERRVPRVIIRLLDEVWRQHSVVIGLRHGVDSEPWRKNLQLIERTLAISAGGLDDPATLSLREELYRELSAVLSQVVSDEALRNRLVSELEALMINADADLMSDVVDAPRFVERVDAAAAQPSSCAAITSGKSLTKPSANGASLFHIGDWWDMRIERKWIPVQLIWESESKAYFGFVNRSASNRLEMTQVEFRRQLDNSAARSRDSLDMPLLDRSEFALLNEAYNATVQRGDLDLVTGLLTRRGFQKRLNELDSHTDGGHNHVVGLLECDQFRTVSSTCGIDAVESLAKALTERLQRRLPKDCTAAMLREDTFAVVMPDHSRQAGARAMSELLAGMADYHFVFEQHSYSIGVSAGLASFGSGQCDATEVLRRADSACLAAKSIGRNRVQEYEPNSAELRGEETQREWAGRVDTILASDQLFLRAQMVMPISPDSDELPYYEILLGIDPSSGHNGGPYEFVLALERMGRSHEIDLWVLRQSFQWITDNWIIMDSIAGVSINLSVPSLRNPDIIRFLRQELSRAGFPAQKVAFEITETAAIRDFDIAEQFIQEIHRYGCRFSLDDFGSGFTSYAHLKRLSTDTLKIDGSYVKDLLLNPSDMAIVKSMTDIAHTLGMKVVAEWVETPEILEKLIELGVDYAQGYAVHKPVPLSKLVAAPA